MRLCVGRREDLGRVGEVDGGGWRGFTRRWHQRIRGPGEEGGWGSEEGNAMGGGVARGGNKRERRVPAECGVDGGIFLGGGGGGRTKTGFYQGWSSLWKTFTNPYQKIGRAYTCYASTCRRDCLCLEGSSAQSDQVGRHA